MIVPSQLAGGVVTQRVKSKGVSRQATRLVLAALAFASLGEIARAELLPGDIAPECSFESTEVSGWFEGGTIRPNGFVNPADSVNFEPDFRAPPNHRQCNFYKWSAQMFLWLMSPVERGRVFQNPDFYTVTPLVDGKRNLVKNDPDKVERLALRSAKLIERGGSVLMAQNKSLVYTISIVNDVYAFYRTGVWNRRFDGSRFPILMNDLTDVIDYAAENGTTISNRKSFVIELKTTWVQTAGLEQAGLDPNKYIKTTVPIPTYDMTHPRKWLSTQQFEMKELALVGIHLVGSLKGHSDMVWASFEHTDNAPVAPFNYMSTSGLKTADGNPGPWLLSARNSTGPFNIARMHVTEEQNIESDGDQDIGPSDTRREHAWGSADNNPVHNARVIAINKGTLQKLPDGDVRKHYLLIGATWSSGVGSNLLANTTLETYEQNRACFHCHRGELPGGMLSRIYLSIQPLLTR